MVKKKKSKRADWWNRRYAGLRPHYSASLSQKFWGRVNSIKDGEGDLLYTMGCDLQDIEMRLLQALDDRLDHKGRRRKMEKKS